MKKIMFIIFFAPISVFIFSINCAKNSTRGDGLNTDKGDVKYFKNDQIMKDDWGKDKKGLVSRIKLIKHEDDSNGQTILIRYEIKNISNDTIIIWQRGFWPNHKIVVLDEMQNEALLTEDGLIRRKAFESVNEGNKNFKVSLKPGEIYENFTQYDITDFFHLEKVKKYYVRYIYEEDNPDWKGKLESNTLEVIL